MMFYSYPKYHIVGSLLRTNLLTKKKGKQKNVNVKALPSTSVNQINAAST